MDFKPGAVIGDHFRIIERIGSGGMGVVFKALDIKLGRFVAIKVLSGPVDRNERNRFSVEARATAAINHPNIATIYSVGEADSVPFIVLEFIDAADLRSRTRNGPIAPEEALAVTLEIAAGLKAAHTAGIVHRDIKPANILLTSTGEVKITDFGVARIEAMTRITSGDEMLGTMSYMAPEQIRGGPVDHRVDIWALGAVFYELMSGRQAFEGPNAAAILYSILNDEPAPITRIRPGLPQRVDEIVRLSLSKDPVGRYSSIEEMLVQLRGLEDSLKKGSTPAPAQDHQSITVQISRGRTQVTSAASVKAERRQLTVMHCELVGASPKGIDPEDLEKLSSRYNELVTPIISRFEGIVAKTFGEALIAYFGYPRAHEDDAVRAVHTGLSMLEAATRAGEGLEGRERACVEFRIAIHTGLALIKGNPWVSVSVIGDVQAVARRLADTATPNSLLVSDATHRLIAGYFQCRAASNSLNQDEPGVVGVYEVLRANAGVSRLETTHTSNWTPLAGRQYEVDLLFGCWRRLKPGRGEIVVLKGEAGIGKSRLVQQLSDHVRQSDASVAQLQCSPYHQNTAFFPFTDWLERTLLHFDQADSPQNKRARLEEILAKYGFDPIETVPLFCGLLSVPTGGREIQDTNPRRQKQKTLQAFITLWREISRNLPTLLIVEDLQWADPSSLELLELMVHQYTREQILVLLTSRPEFNTPWMSWTHLTAMTLGRLTYQDSETIIAHIAKDRPLLQGVVRLLISKSDGIPLFLEELTKTFLESRFVSDPRGPELSFSGLIPTSLRDSLSARLDRLPECKETVQHASALGREFPFQWLLAIRGISERELELQIDQLLKAELFYIQGVLPDATVSFKHALIQEAAYESVPKSVRLHHHREITRILPIQFPEVADRHPEYLAFHCAQAGLSDLAVGYWNRAGEAAVKRSANLEAARHFRSALEVLSGLTPSAERTAKRLDLLIDLGGPLLALQGYASAEVGEVFTQAGELCEQLDDSPRAFDGLQGLWAFNLVRGRLEKAQPLARRLDQISDRLGSSHLKLEALLRLGISCSMLGDPISAREHFENVLRLYQPEQHRVHARRYGQDPLVACLCHLSLVLWLLGYPDASLAKSDEAVRIATSISHAFSQSWALLYSGIVHTLRGEVTAAAARAHELADLSSKQAFAYRFAQSRILKGWALSDTDDDESLKDIRTGINEVAATGAEVYLPCYLALASAVSQKRGRYEESLLMISDALAIIERTGEHLFEAELYRLKGVAVSFSQSSETEAEACFQKALEISRVQHARSLELRALTSLTRFKHSHDRTSVVSDLKQFLATFTEGHQTADYLEAKKILANLS